MKARNVVALILVLVGTNLFTFATTRYLTTKDVLTRAQQRLDAALKNEGLYDQVFPPDRPRSVPISMAIGQAGGLYYWWNDAFIYWGLGFVLIASGVLVPFLKSERATTV